MRAANGTGNPENLSGVRQLESFTNNFLELASTN